MSQKTRVDKLHSLTVRKQTDSLESRELFDMRVERLKRGYAKFGCDLTHEEATLAAYDWATKRRYFCGFAFDLADMGLEIENDTLDSNHNMQ